MRWPEPLIELAQQQHGIIARHELINAGVSTDQIRRAVQSGQLVICHSGVYRIATSPDTFESRCVAACLADDSIIVTGIAAGALLGFRHVRTPEHPIVLAEHDRHPVARGVVVRRSNVIGDVDRTTRPDGIVLASPQRAWFDCARDVGDERFEAITEWVLDHHTTVEVLWRTVQRLCARGRPGLARVQRIMSRRSDWQRPAGSMLELRVLRALREAGLPELVRQHPLRLANGIIVHPDGADPATKWAVEVDHVTWHGGRAQAQRDKTRDRNLRRIGWQVDRVTDQELRDNFNQAIAELVELYHLRARDQAA